MKTEYIIKRNGSKVPFDEQKLYKGLWNAISNAGVSGDDVTDLADIAFNHVMTKLNEQGFNCTTAAVVQASAVQALADLAPAGKNASDVFLKYAYNRCNMRELQHLRKQLEVLTNKTAKDAGIKRENANVDGDTAMGTMLRYGSEAAKSINLTEQMSPDIAEAHTSGSIHIHDLDFYSLTETCCQIDLGKLLKNGFSTGHGFLREPQSIRSAASLACIAIQANQNDQHGGQSVPCFDFYLAPYVTKTARAEIKRGLVDAQETLQLAIGEEKLKAVIKQSIDRYLAKGYSLLDNVEIWRLASMIAVEAEADVEVFARILRRAIRYTQDEVYQAMEALVGNLNTMNSRAGAQTPFSSLNFGTDTSPEGRSISQNLMQVLYDGLGNGETSIFPIAIFKVKKGVNFEPGTPNYDLYQQALRITAKRMFPNFSFLDAPYNLKYYVPGRPETEVAYMGCRSRVIGNVYDSSREITEGRGNLSFTTINLPRLGILCKKDLNRFYVLLDEMMELVRRQLLERFAIQCKKTVRNYPFLMGQGIWIDSDKLYADDSVADVLKHGTLTLGFIGLAECLKAITGKHHGESDAAQEIGLGIVKHMREFTDRLCEETGLNWSLIATPAEGLAGRFVEMDRERFGSLKGITDKEWYTNSFHIPVEFEITAFRKLALEGPYHEFTNGGHISYVELNGDVSGNIEALDQIVRRMSECGVGYGAINHPVDRDSVCQYVGVIGNTCPLCGRSDRQMAATEVLADIKRYPAGHNYGAVERGLNVPFQRIRRITGYLVGTIDRFNDAKREELEHRYKHL